MAGWYLDPQRPTVTPLSNPPNPHICCKYVIRSKRRYYTSPTFQTFSKFAPHTLQPKLDILQLLPHRLPRLKHTQQLLHFRPELSLHKLLLQQSSHSPRQEKRIDIRTCSRRFVLLDPQFIQILDIDLGANIRDTNALKTT